jgi:glucose-1-phosphate thymidylyltransferase
MKALLLCGGFAKRLLPLTANTPKALLDVGGTPLLGHTLRKLENVAEIDEILISTNSRFESDFQRFVASYNGSKHIKLVVEPTLSEGEKLGSVGGIKYALDSEHIDDDVLIIAGDNLFDFDLSQIISYWNRVKSPVIGVYDIRNKEKAKLLGVVQLRQDGCLMELKEKPKFPETTLISTAIYLLAKDNIALLNEYVAGGNPMDKSGHFISWLLTKIPVYGWTWPGSWFDIGDIESLEQARKWVLSNIKSDF